MRYADVEEPVAVGHARVVVNGADGPTLDEVIEPAAVRVGGRQGRLNVSETRRAVSSTDSRPVPGHVRDRYVDQWTRVRTALENALVSRAGEVLRQRSRAIEDKRDNEEKRLRGTLEDLQASILLRLSKLEAETSPQLRLFNTEDHRQYQADMDALDRRAQKIGDDIDKEVEILRRRYEVRDVNCFPVAAELLVPLRER